MTDKPATPTDRTAAERMRRRRARLTADGRVERKLFVYPETWERIKAYADRQTRAAEKARQNGAQ